MNATVGREVLFLHTDDKTPRNGEGTFLSLKNGAVLFVYTKFSGNDWSDNASADIAAIVSFDDGENWSEPRIIVKCDESANILCVHRLYE